VLVAEGVADAVELQQQAGQTFGVLHQFADGEAVDVLGGRATVAEEARNAADLGDGPVRRFLRITLPLSLPGIVAGSLLVFIPAVGEYVIPALLGGPGSLAIGARIWEDFFNARNYPLAAAVAMAMLVLIVVPMLIFESFQERRAAKDAQGQ
jgi:ABC-type spermidine/putrescine transport system permease subunit I